MPADFPGAITSPRTMVNRPGVVYDAAKTKVIYAEDFNKDRAEIVAIETELGIDPKGTYESVAAFLADLASLISGLVPYSGATADVDLGLFNLICSKLQTKQDLDFWNGSALFFYDDEGVTLNGYIFSADNPGTYIFAGYTDLSSENVLDFSACTPGKVFSFPNEDGIFALRQQADDIEITDDTKGIILKSPDTTRWRVTVDNSGALVVTAL